MHSLAFLTLSLRVVPFLSYIVLLQILEAFDGPVVSGRGTGFHSTDN